MLAGSKPRLQEVPEQVLAGKGGEGTRSTGSKETQLNQAPVEAATFAGPVQTRPATTELQPIVRLRQAWLATESALGPEHTITQAVKQQYEQLVQCRNEHAIAQAFERSKERMGAVQADSFELPDVEHISDKANSRVAQQEGRIHYR